MRVCHLDDGIAIVTPLGITADESMQGHGTFRALARTNNRSMRIMHVFVHPARRLEGICTHMILLLATEARSRRLRRIDLDDMSDAYRTTRNVYVQCGFRYLKKDVGCEMTATPRRVIATVNKKLATFEKCNSSKRN